MSKRTKKTITRQPWTKDEKVTVYLEQKDEPGATVDVEFLVYSEDDAPLGKIGSRMHTPHVNYSGTRIRKDLAPRKVWRYAPQGEDYPSRLYEANQAEAIRRLLSATG